MHENKIFVICRIIYIFKMQVLFFIALSFLSIAFALSLKNQPTRSLRSFKLNLSEKNDIDLLSPSQDLQRKFSKGVKLLALPYIFALQLQQPARYTLFLSSLIISSLHFSIFI